MNIKLFIMTIIITNISNSWGMNVVGHLKKQFYCSTRQPLSTYKEPKREQITKSPTNPTASTIEAHTCDVIVQLLNELNSKQLTVRNIQSCEILINNKKKSAMINKMLKSKHPELYQKTVISYKRELPEGCHAVLEALVKHQYEPQQAKL